MSRSIVLDSVAGRLKSHLDKSQVQTHLLPFRPAKIGVLGI